MKLKALIVFFLMGSMSLTAQKSYQLQSPDKKLQAVVTVGDDIRFSFTHDWTEVLAASPISMTLQNGVVLGASPKVSKVLKAAVDKVIPSPFYKKTEVQDIYNEMTLSFRGNYGLVFRMYNDGLAYRFTTKMKNDIVVVEEEADYTFSSDHMAFAPYVNSKKATFEEQFMNSFEQPYVHEPITKLNSKRLMILPLLVELDGGKKLCITEADLEDYPGMFLNNSTDKPVLKPIFASYPKVKKQGGHNNLQMLVEEREDYIAKTSGTRAFPWRVFIVSENDKQLADCDMVYRLASPCRLQDVSWVKPGKVAWDWWNDWGIYNVDFKAGINMDTYKYYIDFAADNRIEFVVLDEGWYNPGKGDMLTVVPELDLEELVRYGKSKGVDLILWTVFNVLDDQLEEACTNYSEMGISGFKVDFLDRDDQTAVEMAYRIAEMTAKYKLTLDLHGFYKPTGLNRTYPNIINYEAVFGMEEMKWSSVKKDMMEYDVTMPYIRMMAGPVDYTPGAMRNASKKDFKDIYYNPMSQGTRCHQLAAYIVHDSPLTMLADNPTIYKEEQECTDFIVSIPNKNIEETRVLQGKLGESIVMARKVDSNWYVGGMTDWNQREITLDFGFLSEGTYEVTLFSDGVNANKQAEDYKKETFKVTSASMRKINMASGGGFAMAIVKK